MEKNSKSNSKPGAANPLPETVQTVPGIPSKLKIFKVPSSRYWWTRVYLNGRYRISSLKTIKLRDAQEAAKKFFYQALIDAELCKSGSGKRSVSRAFVSIGPRFIESQHVPDKQRRYKDDRIRFNKELVPFFGDKDIWGISSADIGSLAREMQQGGKSAATVNQYLIVLRKIFEIRSGQHVDSVGSQFSSCHGASNPDKAGLLPN